MGKEDRHHRRIGTDLHCTEQNPKAEETVADHGALATTRDRDLRTRVFQEIGAGIDYICQSGGVKKGVGGKDRIG